MTVIAPAAGPGRLEFVALMAMLMAVVAASIDSMLPALPEMGLVLSPDAPERAQLVLAALLFGLGVGVLFTGPLSDHYGRRPVMIGGALLYVAGALLGALAPDLTWLVVARVVQGLGAAGPRVVALAVIRDRHQGRDMAQIMSLVMIVFMVVPAIAPALGAVVIGLAGWRALFLGFAIFGAAVLIWFALRLPETLPLAARRPLSPRPLAAALMAILRHPTARRSILVQLLTQAMLFAMLATISLVMDETYGRLDELPWWFALIALCAGLSSFANSRLVMRLGMVGIVRATLSGQIVLSGLTLAAFLADLPPGPDFAVFIFWATMVFFQGALLLGNLTTLAMEPLGAFAGLGSSVIASLATVGSVVIAVPVGLAFDGTPLPLAFAMLILAILARLVAQGLPAGR